MSGDRSPDAELQFYDQWKSASPWDEDQDGPDPVPTCAGCSKETMRPEWVDGSYLCPQCMNEIRAEIEKGAESNG